MLSLKRDLVILHILCSWSHDIVGFSFIYTVLSQYEYIGIIQSLIKLNPVQILKLKWTSKLLIITTITVILYNCVCSQSKKKQL